MRLGLFQVLYFRVLAVIAAAILGLIVVSLVYQVQVLNTAWRAEIQQETVWTARHFGIAAEAGSGGAPASNGLARAWRSMHETLRLMVRDQQGRVVVDSHPEQKPPNSSDHMQLIGRTQITASDGRRFELTLSRPAPRVYFIALHWQFLVSALLIAVLAAAAVYPLTNSLTQTFRKLSAGAERVAAGQFGAPLEAKGARELEALVTSFNAMSLQLQEEDTRRGRLIADVSHELRSPMGRIRALAETLARHPDEVAPVVAQMEGEIALMDRLVADMLQIVRLDADRNAVALQAVAIKSWARDAFERLRARVEQAGVAFHADVAGEEFTAAIDPQRLVQALGNLVENALAAIAGGSDGVIAIALASSANEWTLSVTDNGRGIPNEHLPRVFDRFFRIQEDRGRASGGAGLGLSIVKAIVTAHGGRIEIDSEEGAGTKVQMIFPTQIPHEHANAPT